MLNGQCSMICGGTSFREERLNSRKMEVFMMIYLFCFIYLFIYLFYLFMMMMMMMMMMLDNCKIPFFMFF